MMGSKAFIFLCLFVAICAMISSEVVARELAETSLESDNKNDEHTDGRSGYNGYKPPRDKYNNGYKSPGGGYKPPGGGYRPPNGEYKPPHGGYKPPGGGYNPPHDEYKPPSDGHHPPGGGGGGGHHPPHGGYNPPGGGHD
ncbi:hypothetical protein H5410_049073 [Solanum commersonii]|uniref:Glycine-rich protein n=1 Tax=Solanum commersonii TaxID=4109 RepID=A0A9J5XME7_SOLCO|nr:hypothetical protein H5410_049073 [Solanum commersonii]